MLMDKLWRLQEYCEKLLFYCPLEYGRKAEELIWRKAFYEIIQLMKHNRKVFHSCLTLKFSLVS